MTIRVRAAGTGVSHLRMMETDADGYVHPPYRMRLPLVPGHEIAGVVVDVGAQSANRGPGHRSDATALRCLPCVWEGPAPTPVSYGPVGCGDRMVRAVGAGPAADG
ncbi:MULTISPECIES: alcohol dehydrogenase catalytic domain-containing protein [unclassified Streptomyces]|uniref:alcohol dehydrogenase catalytic domain-containing protein n=1 Tax=unclassified Streptomyces TaxID=2593676 RepID=UPI00403C50AF